MPRADLCRPHRHQGGFTYLALLILVATLALATSATLTLGSIATQTWVGIPTVPMDAYTDE